MNTLVPLTMHDMILGYAYCMFLIFVWYIKAWAELATRKILTADSVGFLINQ